jgi:hypothetical protein
MMDEASNEKKIPPFSWSSSTPGHEYMHAVHYVSDEPLKRERERDSSLSSTGLVFPRRS